MLAKRLSGNRLDETEERSQGPTPLALPLRECRWHEKTEPDGAMSAEPTSGRQDTTPAAIAPGVPALKRPARRPQQSVTCGWCGTVVAVPARGRVPKWCSSSCRHRAWELSRAAASGHAAIQIVDRVIEVDKPVTQLVEVTVSPRGARWPAALADLARQLDSGRVYDRDLPGLADALREVLAALDRRAGWRRGR